MPVHVQGEPRHRERSTKSWKDAALVRYGLPTQNATKEKDTFIQAALTHFILNALFRRIYWQTPFFNLRGVGLCTDIFVGKWLNNLQNSGDGIICHIMWHLI